MKEESKRIGGFLSVGLLTTFATYLFISFFNYIFTFIKPADFRSSISYFLGAFLMIGVSLYLNRKVTFKKIQRRHEKKSTTIIHYYAIYTTTAFATSLFVYFIQQKLTFDHSFEIIKIIGLCVNVILNYIGQRFWIFQVI